MTNSHATIYPSLFQFSRLRDLFELLIDLQQMREPLTTPAGLREAIELFEHLAELLGVEPAWIERLHTILTDEHVFNIVLAIVQYLMFLLWEADEADVLDLSGSSCGIDAQSFSDWLPQVLELITLWRYLRGV
jgi:hypothetical protein